MIKKHIAFLEKFNGNELYKFQKAYITQIYYPARGNGKTVSHTIDVLNFQIKYCLKKLKIISAIKLLRLRNSYIKKIGGKVNWKKQKKK